MFGIGERLIEVRRVRMWTQARLAREAEVSPTTVSGIESGRISRPHFGTVHKLARALGVAPETLLSSEEPAGKGPVPLSIEWTRTAREEEFEREIEGASLDRLESLSGELKEEQRRLQRLYGKFPQGSEQRRLLKQQIRQVAGHSGSVATSAIFHRSRTESPDGPAAFGSSGDGTGRKGD